MIYSRQKVGKPLPGPVEVGETYIGGREANKHAHKKLHAGRGTISAATVAGIKHRGKKEIRAQVVPDTSRATLQGLVSERVKLGAVKYTDEHSAYEGMPTRESVKNSVGYWVKGQAHTNGIESFWSMLKRGYYGTYHKMSVKHLHRYVNEFAGRHNIRDKDTIQQMCLLASGLVGKRVRYRELVV